MAYESAFKLLEGFWAKPWCDLPLKQREVWYVAAYLNTHQHSVGPCEAGTPEMSAQFVWDEWGTEQRKSIAAQHDQRHDPANEEENEFWFNNACDISDVEREIREIELQPTPLPSERQIKNQQLTDARQQLADLKSAQFTPSTVESHSGTLDSAGLKIQAISGVDRNRILAAFPPPKNVTDKQWSGRLGEPNKQMKAARVFSGGPNASALWNPAKFAMYYANSGFATKQAITVIMRREFSSWLPEWEIYTASFD